MINLINSKLYSLNLLPFEYKLFKKQNVLCIFVLNVYKMYINKQIKKNLKLSLSEGYEIIIKIISQLYSNTYQR